MNDNDNSTVENNSILLARVTYNLFPYLRPDNDNSEF